MKLPDGPQSPLWLETLQFVLRPIEFLESRRERYGDAFTLGSKTNSPMVYLSHPEAIKEIFTADPKNFDSGRANKLFLEPLLGEYSLAVQDGEPHQRHRRLLMPPFHGQRMRTYGQLICDITQQVISEWMIGNTVFVHSAMEEITLRAILQAIFGMNQGQSYDRLRQLFISFINSTGSPISAAQLYFPALRRDLGSWSPWGQFVRLKQQIYQILDSEIQQRRQSLDPERSDILTLLLIAKDEAGQPITDSELRDQMLTLLFGGYETVTNALTWALYWIHYLPEVKSLLLAEIDTIDPDVNPSEIARLPYLTAVVSETLRIYPTAMVTSPRILKSSYQITGYDFKPGTVLMPCIYLAHQQEDLYPEPKRFKPERFLERQFSTYEYLPFGGGNRSCIGMAFAMFEMKLVLATILREKQLAIVDERPVKPVRRGPALAAPDGLAIVVIGSSECEKAVIPL